METCFQISSFLHAVGLDLNAHFRKLNEVNYAQILGSHPPSKGKSTDEVFFLGTSVYRDFTLKSLLNAKCGKQLYHSSWRDGDTDLQVQNNSKPFNF